MDRRGTRRLSQAAKPPNASTCSGFCDLRLRYRIPKLGGASKYIAPFSRSDFVTGRFIALRPPGRGGLVSLDGFARIAANKIQRQIVRLLAYTRCGTRHSG
jgi:hypothetical protein